MLQRVKAIFMRVLAGEPPDERRIAERRSGRDRRREPKIPAAEQERRAKDRRQDERRGKRFWHFWNPP